jgi:8-oxo-dGTP pyrophosphatase MutT (NUDIX family)
MQMYKVFIENNPIHFISKDKELPLGVYSFVIKDSKSATKKVEQMLKSKLGFFELFLICENVEDEFANFFKSYKFLEAAGGIVHQKDKYLFIKRNGVWDIPKGIIESDESPEVAAVREVEEECGISKPEVYDRIGVTFHTYKYDDERVLKKTYWFKMNYYGEEILTPQAEEGITEVKWLHKKDLYRVKKNTFMSIIDVLDNNFK